MLTNDILFDLLFGHRVELLLCEEMESARKISRDFEVLNAERKQLQAFAFEKSVKVCFWFECL